MEIVSVIATLPLVAINLKTPSMKNYTSHLLILLFVCFSLSDAASQQRISVPNAPSPAASVSQTIGLSTVSVNYSRPSVRDREIWGKVVPYGWNVDSFGAGEKSPWRAGANENTVIEFSHDATLEGKAVPAGRYGLFFVINADNSGEVILSKDYRSWGHYWYDATHDQLRAPITIKDHEAEELLTYEFIDVTKDGVQLVLNWEKKQFPVKIQFAVHDIVMANAKEELKGPVGFSWQGPASAANYALQNKTHLDEASVWIDQALAQNKSFGTLIVKAGILKESGKTAEADKARTEALAVATEAELNAYGYQFLANDPTKAVEIFKLTTQRFPKSANAWDSLGEGYASAGDKKNAITSFKKALSMNPSDNVKVNSEKHLTQLGAMK